MDFQRNRRSPVLIVIQEEEVKVSRCKTFVPRFFMAYITYEVTLTFDQQNSSQFKVFLKFLCSQECNGWMDYPKDNPFRPQLLATVIQAVNNKIKVMVFFHMSRENAYSPTRALRK